jgi:hypothetical protein
MQGNLLTHGTHALKELTNAGTTTAAGWYPVRRRQRRDQNAVVGEWVASRQPTAGEAEASSLLGDGLCEGKDVRRCTMHRLRAGQGSPDSSASSLAGGQISRDESNDWPTGQTDGVCRAGCRDLYSRQSSLAFPWLEESSRQTGSPWEGRSLLSANRGCAVDV